MWTRAAHLLLTTAVIGVFGASAAFAQQSPVDKKPKDKNAASAAEQPQGKTTGVEAIVVTAQRRGENLQKVPIAVTVFSEEELKTRGLTKLQSLEAAVPTLTMTTWSRH